MIKLLTNRYTYGISLILAGLLFTAQNFGLIPNSGYIWAGILGVYGLLFLVVFVSERKHWWAAFPAFALLGITLIILLETVFNVEGDWTGAVFMIMLGLGFWAVYLRSPENWWAVIPGGAFFSIALVVTLEFLITEPGFIEIGGVFLLGLGLTFMILFFLPKSRGRQRWAIWPGASLLVVGGLTTAAATDLMQYIWPVFLILLGIGLIVRNLSR